MVTISRIIAVLLWGLLPTFAEAGIRGATVPWLPSYLGSNILWFDNDPATFTFSTGNVATWTDKVSSVVASATGTGPAYSATARNGLPGFSCSSSVGNLTFSAAGLPTTGDSTIVAVGYMNPDSNYKTFGGYGGGSSGGDSRLIMSPSSTNNVGASILSYDPSGSYSWSSVDHIVIAQFQASTGIISESVDGNINPSFQHSLAFNTQTTHGDICSSASGASKWNGVVQTFMVIPRLLTQLESDKLSGYLAWHLDLTGLLPNSHPYKFIPPSTQATLSQSLMPDYNVVWGDYFTSLSLRTGGYWSGTTTGYNAPTAKGTWAFDGLSYMTNPQGNGGFGWDFFVNANYNWQAIDPTFPPLGMVDITSNGLMLLGSQSYPAIRSALTPTSKGAPFLSAILTTLQSSTIGIPFAMRTRGTLVSSSCYDFPANWMLGSLYNGSVIHTNHQEIDAFERYGCESSNLITSAQHAAIFIGGTDYPGGINFNIGSPNIPTGPQFETVVIVHSDFIYFYTNGVLTYQFATPAGWDSTDVFGAIENFSVGMSFECYPGNFNGSISGTTLTVADFSGCHVEVQSNSTQTLTGAGVAAGTIVTGAISGTGRTGTYTVNNSQTVSIESMQLTPALSATPTMNVRSVEYLAPASNTSGSFPPAPPVPTITWGSCCTGGNIPVGTSNGVTVATLSGASTYALLDYNSASPSNLAVSGSNVVTSGSLSVGTFPFYIRGVAVDGTPGIAPKLSAVIN